MTEEAWGRERRTVITNALSVGAATGAYGISFGAIAVTGGLTVLQTQVLSALMFTGGSQFALVGVLIGGGGAASAVAASVLLGVRNAFYGLRLAPILHVHGLRRAAAAHLTIDESTAMTLARDETRFGGRGARLAFWLTGLSVFAFWNTSTLIGSLSASAIGDPRALGLDAAIPAGFLALVWPRLKDRASWSVAVGAGLVALVLTPFLRPGVPVLAAALVAVVAGVLKVRTSVAGEPV